MERRLVNLNTLDNLNYLWNEFSLAYDFLVKTSSVELLIGNDYYLDIILPQKMEIQSGLYMLGSKHGWILSGQTSEIVERTMEPSMLILTHGKENRKCNNLYDWLRQITTYKTKCRRFLKIRSHRYN